MKCGRLFAQFVKVISLLSVLSCQRYRAREAIVNANDTYFSIKQYAADQIQMFGGVPHGLYRITHLDGAVDTTMANFMNMDWAPIFQVLSESDISSKKFLGSYDFSIYDDDATASRGLIYTAKDPKLLTRTLQISTDPSNNRITSIYIEMAKHDFFGSSKKKILYVPLRIIQIQETKSSLFGKAHDLRVDYRFMGEDEVEQM
jgi:hypothetical protein